MSSLKNFEKKFFENLFEMNTGYVLAFSDRTFGDFFSDFQVDIHSDKYVTNGTSKAKKLRSFWSLEPDALVVEVLEELVRYYNEAVPRDSPDEGSATPEDLVGANKAIARLKTTSGQQAAENKPFFLASLTVMISDVSFSDFIKQSGSSNSLRKFQSELAELQTQLEAFPQRHLNLPIKFKILGDSRLERKPRTVTMSDFSITNVTYTDGSVVAKIQIGCAAVLGATTFLAAYPDAKDGYFELRDDLQTLSSSIFEAVEENGPPARGGGSSYVSYYFLKPETVEENLKKLRIGANVDPDD